MRFPEPSSKYSMTFRTIYRPQQRFGAVDVDVGVRFCYRSTQLTIYLLFKDRSKIIEHPCMIANQL